MNEKQMSDLGEVIVSLESRLKHYGQVAQRHAQEEMARGFSSALNDFDYSIQILRAIRDNRGFDDLEEEDA